MTRHEYLKLINGAKDKFVMEAIQSREQARPSGIRKNRIFLIAAVIAAILVLAGCAAHFLGIWDLLLPQKVEVIPSIQDDPEKKPYEVDVISLAGFMETPESQALAQWQTFLEGYDPQASTNEIFAPGTSYNLYQVLDQTMADKLDGITAQYGLKLHTGISSIDQENLCQAVGGDFMGQNNGYGYIFEDGSFHIDGDIELPGYGLLDYQMNRNVRGTFSDVTLSVNNIQAWQEWAYATKDGTAVTLALSPIRGLIIADLPDSFVTINVLAGTESKPEDVFSSGPIGKAEMEALANSFDFTLLTPARPVSLEILQANSLMPTVPPVTEKHKEEGCPNLAMSETYPKKEAAYAALLEDLLLYRIFPDGSPYEPFDDTPDQFALADVNGDGAEELLLSASNSYMAGMRFYVLAFDEEAGKLREEMNEWPALSFYGNGIAKADASHNQGRAGDALWPYTLYRYDSEMKRYRPIAMVDAWDKQFGETYLEVPFPSEADTSGTGVVYYVMDPDNYVLENPMDITEYESWCEEQFGSEPPIHIPWTSLTKEAIQKIREN